MSGTRKRREREGAANGCGLDFGGNDNVLELESGAQFCDCAKNTAFDTLNVMVCEFDLNKKKEREACDSTEVSDTQKGKQGADKCASVGRFPREKASPEAGLKGPMRFIRLWEGGAF